MATPTITETIFTDLATAHLVDMPASVAASDLLVAIIILARDEAITTPSGWTLLDSTNNSTSVRVASYYKIAVGDEDGTTVDFVTADVAECAAQVWQYAVADWHGTTAPEIGTAAVESTNTPDAPSVTASWGAEDNSFLPYSGCRNERTVSSYPSGYGDGSVIITGHVTDASLASSHLTISATATEDPGVLTWNNSGEGVSNTIVVRPAASGASCVVTGTAVSGGVLESEIVTGSETIILTLTNDTWVATVGADNSITTELIAGIDSGGSETAGWDAEVKGNMAFGEITRTSDTVVTIALAVEAAYAITANETITVTVPANALTAAGVVVATPTFDVTNETPTCAVTGTAQSGGVIETEIVTGGETIILTLTGAKWVATAGDDNAITDAIIAGIDSGQAESAGWDAEVKGNMVFGDVARTSDTVITVTLAAEAAYKITADETITVTIPDTAILNQSGMVASPTFVVTAAVCIVTGTAVSGGVLESEIVTGTETIILTLTGDTWVATVGADNAITDALIAGIDSGGAETAGWDAVVKGNMVFGDVARTSATVVTITLAAESTYAITANETITVTVPATALTAAGEMVATPTFDVTNETPTCALTGTAQDGGVLETEIGAGAETIILTLTGAQWVATAGDDNAITDAIIAGIDSAQGEGAGWDAVVKGNMVFGDVARTSATVITITLGAEPTYAITANETITVTIPDSAILNQSGMTASPTFAVTNENPTCAVTGTAITGGVLETEIVTGGETIILTLTGATWVATAGDDNAITTAIIAGIDSAQAEGAGWDVEVKGNMVFGDVARTSGTVITITLAAESAYAITSDETITATIPNSAILNQSAMTASPTFVVTSTVTNLVAGGQATGGEEGDALRTALNNAGISFQGTIKMLQDYLNDTTVGYGDGRQQALGKD